LCACVRVRATPPHTHTVGACVRAGACARACACVTPTPPHTHTVGACVRAGACARACAHASAQREGSGAVSHGREDKDGRMGKKHKSGLALPPQPTKAPMSEGEMATRTEREMEKGREAGRGGGKHTQTHSYLR
jgi:hypothetical protein